MNQKRILATIIGGLFLLMLIMPQLASAHPVISDVVVPDITATTATITWRTNTLSDSRVNYGTTTALGMSEYDSDDLTHHSILLEDLTPDTIYYFEVQSTDASGTTTDDNGGEYYSFKTLLVTEDSITLAPVFGVYDDSIEVTVNVKGAGTYHVCWDSTDEENRLKTFEATTAESFTFSFRVPEATRGIHKVYLTNASYSALDSTNFEVFPTVEIDPKEGPVSTEVAINGYGFEDEEDDIEVSYRDRVIMEALQADNLGSWLIFYTVPPTPGGDYTFEVRAEEAAVECEYWTERFTVTPEIILSSSSGMVDKTVAVSGTGFAKDEGSIEITFDGEEVKKDIYADKDGSWRATFAIPVSDSGLHIIDASGISTRARDVPDVSFIVSVGISVEPSSAYVGDRVTVRGGAFAPGEGGIRVIFDGGVVAADITADNDGSWEISFVLPPSSYGSHTVSAYGDITQPADVTGATLSTLAQIELNPVEGGAGSAVSLSGSGFNSAEVLTVKFDGTTVLQGVGTDGRGNFIATFTVPASPVGEHTVTVTDAVGATASAIFTVEAVVLATPQLILPQGGSKTGSGEVAFQWLGITGLSGITYTLEISNTADFAIVLRSKSGIGASSYQLTTEEALSKGTYYWRVKAVDAAGNESQWSSPSPFTVSPRPIWPWIIVGLVVVGIIIGVAYRATKFKVRE
jgi:hypothetical protein